MYLVFVLCVWIVFGIVFVDWKSWKEYYPTILYYCTMNFLYEFLYYNHTLFAFRAVTTSLLNHTIIQLAFIFFIMPVADLIYLQRYPRNWKNAVIYIFVWSTFFWAIEFLFFQKGMFVYDNGWNIWHSYWFDILMFVMLRIHFKRPVLALALSAVAVAAMVLCFPIPFENLK